MSNNKWMFVLALFAGPLIIILFIAYYISFVAFANTDNTDQLVNNLAEIHTVLTGEKIVGSGEFSQENINRENSINKSTDQNIQQTTRQRLEIAGYEILYDEDINGVEGNEIVAVKKVDLDVSSTYPDMMAISDLRVYTDGPAIDQGWPLLMFDSINSPTSILDESQPPINNLQAISTEWDPNHRIKFTLCPIDHEGQPTAQCGGFIWDGRLNDYDFYGGGKTPDWEALK